MDDYSWDLRVQSAVGIDLGTTCSCVAVYRQGRVSLAPDENGHKLVPSVVAIRNNRGRVQKIVGNAALEHNVVENIITESKRLLGRKIDDPNVQSLRERSTFEIVESRTGNAEISLQLDGKRHRFSPEDISSAILAKLKLMAEKHIGGDTEVNAAVITVPAYFNNVQREATKRAAMDVGLDVLAIVNEPSAAAIAYGLRSRVREARKILVVDIGGGTSDVSLVQVIEEKFDVLSSKGDNNLGGEDFDTNLVTYCVQLIIQQHGVDIRKHNEAMKRLRDQCKLVKHKLSENPADPHWHYLLEIDDLVTNVDISLPISRKQFEKLNENLFQKIIQLITDCLITAKLKHEDIDEVVPVGGSMRTPKLRELVQNEFNGKRLYSYINPDEAIAVGASIFAAQITGNYNGHFMLSEITPLSLGVRVKLNKEMSIVIPRNSKLPCKVTKRYQTLKENQKAAKIAIYQGENVLVKDNALLGEIEMTGLEGDLPSQNIMHVTFEISTDGLFKVRVEELSTRREVEREFESLIPSLAVFNVGDKANGAKK